MSRIRSRLKRTSDLFLVKKLLKKSAEYRFYAFNFQVDEIKKILGALV